MKTKIFIVMLCTTNLMFPQVGGISGSKLCVPSFDIIPKGSVEFEPSLMIFRADNMFNNNGSLETLSGENVSSDLAFRITTGITNSLEIGASFTTSVDQVQVGAKYAFPFNSGGGFSLMTGVSIPAGNKFIPDSLKDRNDFYTASIGGILSIVPMESLYIDGAASYTGALGSSSQNILNYGASVGYFVTEDFQPIIELSGYSNLGDKYNFAKLSLNYGMTIVITKKLLVVIGSQIDLTGKDEEKGVGYFSAFTITIN